MTIPLLEYKPASQNQRVNGYEVPNEDTPTIYRTEAADTDVSEIIWAAYRQIFSEHLILKSYRQAGLESQLKNRAITVRDFVAGLAKSAIYRQLVIETNSNYRVVEITVKRILGRDTYNEAEKISWSIVIATKGFEGFIDTLVNSEEYNNNFGDAIVPFQRRRYKDRPFNLVTPRYADYWRDKLDRESFKPGLVSNFLDLARSLSIKELQYVTVNVENIKIPDTTRDDIPKGVAVSIAPSANFPV